MSLHCFPSSISHDELCTLLHMLSIMWSLQLCNDATVRHWLQYITSMFGSDILLIVAASQSHENSNVCAFIWISADINTKLYSWEIPENEESNHESKKLCPVFYLPCSLTSNPKQMLSNLIDSAIISWEFSQWKNLQLPFPGELLLTEHSIPTLKGFSSGKSFQ